MSRSRYRYCPLHRSKDWTRLLQLEIDGSNKPLRGKIIHRSIDSLDSYVALPYVWNDPQPTGSILIDGNDGLSSCKITRSLHDALNDFRAWRRRIPQTRSTVWADGVYINQANLEERAQQVSFTGTIYGQATIVLVHLASDPAGNDRFPQLVHGLVSFGNKREKAKDPLDFDTCNSRNLERFGLLGANDPRWELLSTFIDSIWATRLWIAQEFVLARKHPRLLFGSFTFDFWIPPKLFSLRAHNYTPLPVTIKSSDRANIRHVESLIGLVNLNALRVKWHEYEAKHEPMRLEILPLQMRASLCSDPRDHIYSLASLASDWDLLSIPIDYSTTNENLFILTASRIINSSQSLSVLREAGESGLTLPSWVPDWTRISEPSGVGDLFSAGGTAARGQINWRADEHRHESDLNAMLPDRIAFVSAVFEKGTFDHGTARWCLWMIQNLNYLRPESNYPTRRKVFEATLRTMVAENISEFDVVEGKNSIPVPETEFVDYFDALEAVQYDNPASLEIRRKAKLFQSAVDRGIENRRWCKTVSGRMGLVPFNAQMGDFICIVPGMSRTYVVRKKANGCYRYIGDCYIDGLVRGEAMNSNAVTISLTRVTLV